MNPNLHRSSSSNNHSFQDIAQNGVENVNQTQAHQTQAHQTQLHSITAEQANYSEQQSEQQANAALAIQALQIIESSDDCIKVLDLEGRILFMNRGGQMLLGIQDITPFLNTSWINFWQEEEKPAAIAAIAKAAAGEVCSLQGYCATLQGEPKWWDNKISPIRDPEGKIERLLCISRDITDRKRVEDERKQTEAALQASEKQFRLFTTASSDTVYKMSADWQELRFLEGKNFLASTQQPNQAWIEQYIPPEEQARVKKAIALAIHTKSTFELEHQVIQLDGTIGWIFSRAIPLLDNQNEIVEWLGAASNITARKRVELSAEFLANVTQSLAEATCVEAIIQTVGEQLNHYFQVSICAFIEIDEYLGTATIDHCWQPKNEPSLIGVYNLSEFVTEEFLQIAKQGHTIIVPDITTDPCIADQQGFVAFKIGSFINVPLIRNDEWKFTLGIYHSTPYNWRSDEIELMRELANRIWTKLERTRVEIALRHNQEMFSALVEDAPLGVYMIDAEFRVQQANQTAIATFNIQPLIGQDLAEALRIIWEEPFATQAIDHFRHTLATGESYYSPPIAEARADIPEIQSYDWQLHRITLADGSYGVVCYFYELSEIRRAEEIIRRNADRDSFLVTLNDALRPLTDAIKIQATANRVLGEYLGANRVTYFEVRGANYVVQQDYVNGVESLQGGYAIESFGPELLATYRSGQTASSTNVALDPLLSPEQRSTYASLQIASHIGVPLVKQGEFVAGLAVHSASPRAWTTDEIALAEEVAERTWAAVERARTEAALRASEAKYRELFESLDEGYFLADVIFDENQQPIDIFYLEANPAATRMVGQDYTGRRLSEIDPRYEAYWYDIFGRVARTGIGERLEQYAEPDQKWYDFYVFKTGDEHSDRISVVFKNITERKRREANVAFLAEIGEELSRLSTTDEIMQMACAKTVAHFDLSRCLLVKIDETKNQATVVYDFHAKDLPSLVGTYRIDDFHTQNEVWELSHGRSIVIHDTSALPRSSEAADRFAKLGIGALVNASYVGDGRWKFVLSAMQTQPYPWRNDEIEVLQEIAARVCLRIERAEAEAALQASEAKYRSLFESIDEGFCLIEVLFDDTGKAFDYRFLEANPALEKHTGLVDVIGKTVRELVPQHETYWFEIYGKIAQTGVPERFENAAKELGRVYDVYAFRMGEPQKNKVAVLFNDISQRKQVESALRASEARFRMIVESAHDFAIFTMDLKGGITSWNSGAKRLLGYEESEILGQTGSIIFTPEDLEHQADLEEMYTALQQGRAQDVRWHVRKNGSRFWANGLLMPLRDDFEQIRGFLKILQDMTAQRQAEVEREQLLEQEQTARAEAEQANRIKDEFLAVLSHELRSPLNPILGWSKLLQSGKLDATKTAQALTTIERNAKLQSELIEDLLDVSRILRGKLSLNVIPVDLAFTIQSAIETVRLAAEVKSIQVTANLSPNVERVWGDSTRLQQVVWNLLSNAVKFTPAGGEVNISLERFDSSAQIVVSDTGQGIKPKFLPFVFDYFRQGDGTTTRKFGGLGLGLAIVRHLVELHGGTVSADSPGEGLGATFTVRLPLMSSVSPIHQNNPSRSARSGVLSRPPSDLSGFKILVVDDEPDTRELVAFILEQKGAKVISATSSYEALLLLSQTKPDLLLSDIGMPEMDGYMLIRQIRMLAPEQGGNILAIALTAYAGDTNHQQVLAAGFQKYISKPIEPETLIQTIVNLVHPQ